MHAMRILSITSTFFPHVGGLEKVVLELAMRLREHGVAMDVAHVAPGLRRGTEEVYGITVYRIPLHGSRFLGWAPALRSLKHNYDLLHVHDPQLLAISANVRWTCRDVPAVLSTHGGFWHTNSLSLLKRLFELPYPLGDCPNSWSVDILLLVLAAKRGGIAREQTPVAALQFSCIAHCDAPIASSPETSSAIS